jgi:hypothetical protein
MAGMKVTLDAALRARDVSRPSGADEEQAELDWPTRRSTRRRPPGQRPDGLERRERSDQLDGQPEAPVRELPLAPATVSVPPVTTQQRARQRTRAGQPCAPDH